MSGPITTLQEQVGQCGYADTQSGDPCKQPAMFEDGRCWNHTDTEQVKAEVAEVKGTNVNFAIPTATHERIKAHQRDGETLSGAVNRAFDALERAQWRLTEGEE